MADGDLGQVFLAGIDDGEDFVTANPYLVTIPILRHDLDAADRLQQAAGQVIDGFAWLAGILAERLAVNILEPELSFCVLADFGHQREPVHLLLALACLIEPYAVWFTGIYLVTVHQHGSGGIRRHPADAAVGHNLIDAAGGGN